MAGYDIMFSALKQGSDSMGFFRKELTGCLVKKWQLSRESLQKTLRKFIVVPVHPHMGVSVNGGTQQPWVFLLIMIILGGFGDTTI